MSERVADTRSSLPKSIQKSLTYGKNKYNRDCRRNISKAVLPIGSPKYCLAVTSTEKRMKSTTVTWVMAPFYIVTWVMASVYIVTCVMAPVYIVTWVMAPVYIVTWVTAPLYTVTWVTAPVYIVTRGYGSSNESFEGKIYLGYGSWVM